MRAPDPQTGLLACNEYLLVEDPLHSGVVARSLGPGAPVRRIWAARPAEGYRSPASEAMLQILQDVAQEFREEPSLAAVS